MFLTNNLDVTKVLFKIVEGIPWFITSIIWVANCLQNKEKHIHWIFPMHILYFCVLNMNHGFSRLLVHDNLSECEHWCIVHCWMLSLVNTPKRFVNNRKLDWSSIISSTFAESNFRKRSLWELNGSWSIFIFKKVKNHNTKY